MDSRKYAIAAVLRYQGEKDARRITLLKCLRT